MSAAVGFRLTGCRGKCVDHGDTHVRERRLLQNYVAKAKDAKRTGIALALVGGGRKPVIKPRIPRRVKPVRGGRRSFRALERIYQTGTEHYLRGDYDSAEAAFEKVLKFDPDNAEAKKALERVRRRKK